MSARTKVVPIAAEIWLARKLERPDLTCGVTDASVRRERFRRAIVDGGFADKRCGRHDGRVESFADTFERLFGQPLITTTGEPIHA